MYKLLYLVATVLPILSLANTIFVNGSIYTVNTKKPWAEAIVIEKEKIIFLGDTKSALDYENSDTKIIDLNGSFMMPGIIDAHTHMAIASLMLNRGVNLINAKGKKEILTEIERYVKAHEDEEVISGFGFYPYALSPNGPTAKQLDKIILNKKAFLISNNGHSAWVNSKALEFLKIDANITDPLEGMHYYVRDKNGSPTGYLVEGEAFWPHLKAMGIGSKKDFYKTLKSFLPQLSKLGITTVFDAGIPAVQMNAYEAISQLEDEAKLPLRYF